MEEITIERLMNDLGSVIAQINDIFPKAITVYYDNEFIDKIIKE